MTSNEINGLPIPSALLAAMENGTWRTPAKADAWQPLFPKETARHALLYSLKMIQTENALWPNESRAFYLGQTDAQRAPGDIDPARSLLVADLGPDRMIALDYRESQNRPSVLYVKDYPDGSTRWLKIAPDIETFIRALGLDVGVEQSR